MSGCGRSAVRVVSAPQVVLGSVGELPVSTKKRGGRKKEDKVKAELDNDDEGGDDAEVIEIQDVSEDAGASKQALQERRLRMILEQSGQWSPCFDGLLPQTILLEGGKVGRTVNSVACLQTKLVCALLSAPVSL